MALELAFAKVLKSLRVTKKMSQEELAFKSNLDRTYISMLERGIYQPTLTTIFALSKALNTMPFEMIKLVENEYGEVDGNE
ncbi:helix-turn-helix transcriptional regulator [Paenibacillus alginolyticus]|uniref:helix-turn-helix domain-containing protein n=1 Tax=Paenibacillus alginolyticus TaxID=59839 RepID=UPI00040EC0DD|nr:helix-turn-helix transcriptional regulator [Paenibacillus alginolyticus]MCY9667554.1 helix-turn-helix transcriptional regulator [Paenibacillus alginolyticus]